MTGVWKARKTKPRFPSLPTALGNRCAISTFPQPRPTGPPHQKSNPRKEALRRIASLPPSGSFFNEKMLFAFWQTPFSRLDGLPILDYI